MNSKNPDESVAELDRRTFLGRGTALVGGAIAGMVVEGRAEQKPTASTGTAVESRSARTVEPPNLHPPIAEVRGGKLRGFRDGRTLTFLGVPYAEAGRFELPKPVQPWSGMRDAQAWGPVCPIAHAASPGRDEFVFPHRYWVENDHCQVLNIWTQQLDRTARKPVVVWVHGGGFDNGSSMESYAYDGRNMSEFGGVVVVSLNHRLNILGTLDLSAYGAEYANSRHTGMADIVAALAWVHENIETFGGDPGNVTVCGQSGGGGKVTRLMHIPAAKGLFHKVVAQSGGGPNSGGGLNYRNSDPAAEIKKQQAIAAQTLENLGLRASQVADLKTMPFQQVLAAGQAAVRAVLNDSTIPANGGWRVIADDAFVMREFCDWAANIPMMVGSVFSDNGGTLQSDDSKNDWSAKEVDDRLAAAFGARKAEAVSEFKKCFPHKKVQDGLYYAANMRLEMKGLLARKLEQAKAPVFNYLFAYEYPVNGGITSFHCSEIAFVFHNLHEPHVRVATGDAPAGFVVQDRVSQAWVNFARTGDPSQPGLAVKPYTARDPQAVVFDTVCSSGALRDDTLIEIVRSRSRRT
jgi:para-nitrobenzyl esterase